MDFLIITSFVLGSLITLLGGYLYHKFVLQPEYQRWVDKTVEHRLKLSKATIRGTTQEHLVPWLPDFPYNPPDARFMGAPIDMIIFDGLHKGKLEKIVFLEIKTGKSQLTSRERQIRKAVTERRVEFHLLRVKENTDSED